MHHPLTCLFTQHLCCQNAFCPETLMLGPVQRAYGTSRLTGGLSPERKSYASHLTAALTLFALCVGAVCIAASMQVKPVEQQLVGGSLVQRLVRNEAGKVR